MKDRKWIKFKRNTPRPQRGQMRFTLLKHSVMWLNQPAFTALRNPAAVELLYDEAEGLIGLVAGDIDAPDTCPVRPQTGANGYWITMRSFCTKFGLKPGRTISFKNPTFDPDGTLVLNYRKALPRHTPIPETAEAPPLE